VQANRNKVNKIGGNGERMRKSQRTSQHETWNVKTLNRTIQKTINSANKNVDIQNYLPSQEGC